MGLDITAYSKAEYLHDRRPETDAWDELWGTDLVWVEDYHGYWPHAFEGMREGMYRVHGETKGFRAGSYSGYNLFRQELSRFALKVEPNEVWHNWDKYKGQPFAEMINFSDAEGFIGTLTCAKLYWDFRQHWLDFSIENSEGWMKDKYWEWMEAFDLAMQNGFVEFH